MGSESEIFNYLTTYGLWFLFIIVYLEYLNLPGLPAGIIMPAVGVLAANDHFNLVFVVFISVVAGILGSLTLYSLGYFVGNPIIDWIQKKFPKSRRSIEKVIGYSERFGNMGVFICRLLPVARTLVSLTSGTFRSKVVSFVIYSSVGISIWNFATIMVGYLATKAVIR